MEGKNINTPGGAEQKAQALLEEKEVEALCRAGGKVMTLGRRILRTETAGLCALCALMALSGNME